MLREDEQKEKKGEAEKEDSKVSNSPYRLLQGRPRLREADRVIINIWPSEDNQAVPGVNVGHVSLETPEHYMSLWPAPRDPNQARRLPPALFAQLKRSWNSYFKMRPPLWKPDYMTDCVSEAICEGECREIKSVDECHEPEQVVALSEGGLALLELGMPVPDGAELLAVKPSHAAVRLSLYGLRIGEIHAEFERLQKNVEGWRLVGSNFLTRLAGQASKENCASLVYRLLVSGGMYRGMLGARGSSDAASVVTPDALVKHIIIAKRQEVSQHPETRDWIFPGESSLTMLEKAHGIASSEKKDGSQQARADLNKPEPERCSIL